MCENTEKRISFRRPVVAAMLLAASLATPLAGQETEGPLSPAGRLRFDVQPLFLSWGQRYGEGDGGSASEPLGTDLTDPTGATLFPGVATLQETLQELLDSPALEARLGSSRAEVSASRVRVPFRLDVGVFDWLAVGVTVPLVKNRTEVAVAFRADTATTNLGLSPALGIPTSVVAFTEELETRASAAGAHADQVCASAPASPECAAARSVATEGERLHAGFLAAYAASPFFLLGSSSAAEALEARVDAFSQSLTELGLGGVSRRPLFASGRLTRADLDLLVSDGAVGINSLPLTDRVGNWQLGDVELHADIRLLEGAVRSAPDASPSFAYQVGAVVLVRLGTGLEDDPDVFFDLPAGDGQVDVEGRAFSNLRAGRFGLWGNFRYGVQRPRTLERRVGPPSLVLLPAQGLATVEWTPGRYTDLEISPRYHLTDELALTLGYRRFEKDADEFVRVSAPPQPEDSAPLPSPPLFTDVGLLALETEESLHEIGGGLAFSTVEAWRQGRASLPFEARFAVRQAVAGGGGRTPEGVSATLGLRVYVRLWGN